MPSLGTSVTIVTVSQAESGLKLLQFLERRIKRNDAGPVPRSAIQRWIRTGQVRVNKGRAKPFDRLEAGQQVRIPPFKATDKTKDQANDRAATPAITPGAGLDIVFEDDELLVLAKPAGLPAHGGTGHTDSLAARLAAAYAEAPFTPALVHRLDKATSGLLLAAKTYAALRRLNDLVATRDTQRGLGKHYLAWVHGEWPGKEPALLEDRLEKQERGGMEKVTAGSGKVARCRVAPLGFSPGNSGSPSHTLLGIRLLTGRTHQIRVQLSSRGHAIVGDVKYGAPPSPETGMLLHACRLDLEGRTFTLAPSWPAPFEAGTLSERFLQSTSS